MSLLLEIAQLPRATFYYHLKRMKKADKYAEAKAEIGSIYHENKGRYEYRRITTALHKRGIHLNHKTVQRLMKQLGLIFRVRVKKYRSYKGEVGKIAPNLLNRDFYAERPNQKWVTDVTEFSLFGQKLYLSPILDLHNGYLVSYTISERPVLSMVTTMLTKAFATIPDGTRLILHSDQGWQYQHKQYQRMLKTKGIWQSMSRKGNCLDNAVAENFFGLLKSELLYLQKFQSMVNKYDSNLTMLRLISKTAKELADDKQHTDAKTRGLLYTLCNQIGNGKNSTMRNFDDLVEISNYCSGRGGGGTQRTTPAHTVAMAGKWEELASTAVENF